MRIVAFKVQREDVEARATVMTFHSNSAGFMLHREVVPNGARAIADEGVRGGESLPHHEIMEEIIECPLHRASMTNGTTLWMYEP